MAGSGGGWPWLCCSGTKSGEAVSIAPKSAAGHTGGRSFFASVLHSAFYAGAYCWGRRPTEAVWQEGRLSKRQASTRPAEDARVFIRDPCFDRILFRGYLPIMSGWQMAQFFNSSGIRFRDLEPSLVDHAKRVKRHVVELAQHQKRPFQYLQEKVRKEELAREIAARDQIQED